MTKMSKAKPIERADQTARKPLSLARIDPLKSLVPSRPLSPLVVWQQQRELWGDQIATFCELHGRLVRAKAAATREEPSSDRALVLFQNRSAIAKVHDNDALEEFRAAHGLTELREQLLDFIKSEISFERGFQMFRKVLCAFGIKVETWEELNKLYPDLTVTEVSLVSLLKRVPYFYLSAGRNGIELPIDIPIWDNLVKRILKTRESRLTAKFVASLYDATTYGLAYVFDCYDQKLLGRDASRNQSLDAYNAGGLTGVKEDVELVPFRNKIRQVFEKLILLAISNKRIHQQLFRESDECFTAAFGMILRKAYKEVTGKEPVYDKPIKTQVEQLSKQQELEVYKKAEELEKNLCRAKVYDLTMGRMLTTEEVFRLVALIEKPPDELFNGFVGYTAAYGLGVGFIKEDGEIVDYSKYRGFFVQRATNIVYYEQVDLEKNAGTMSEIFNGIYEELIARAMGDVLVEGRPQSLLEELRLDFYLATSIDLAIHPREYVEIHEHDPEKKGSGYDAYLHAFGGEKQVVARTTRKIGYEEARLITRTIKLLPKELLKDVKRITKDQDNYMTLEGIMAGMIKQGEYNARDKTITMMENAHAPFNTLTHAERYVYTTTLLHEIGESVWANLNEEQRAGFVAISGWDEKRKHNIAKENLRTNFLSAYSHLSGPNDDFSEHFSFYVMHAQEFREAAERNEAIRRKYEFIKRIFTIGDKTTEYPQISELGIEELNGEIEQEIRTANIEEARALQEMGEEALLKEREERMARTKLTLEEAEIELHGEDDDADYDDMLASNSPFFKKDE